MRLYLIFLIVAFAVGATPLGRRMIDRPLTLIVACTLVASLFYSYRFVT